MRLTEFKALTFDVYGTLIDWESGMINGLKPLTDQVDATLTRDAILQAHAHYESATQAQTPDKIYSQLLAIVHKRLAEEWSVPVSWEDCLAYIILSRPMCNSRMSCCCARSADSTTWP